jgi:probable selenium-dependent hydroxylase accessory protein YqeC
MAEVSANSPKAAAPLPVFSQALGLKADEVVALVGCGGKTSLLWRLALENRSGRVLVAATTKFRPPQPGLVDHVLEDGDPPGEGLNLFGRQGPDGKLSGLPTDWPNCPGCFGGLTILEADGSCQLPLKGWADYEPVVPEGVTMTIGICTVGEIGRPYQPDLVHRPDIFQRLTGAIPGQPITLEQVSAMVSRSEGLFRRVAGRKILFVNQVESPESQDQAERLFARLPADFRRSLNLALAGSVRDGRVLNLGADGL